MAYDFIFAVTIIERRFEDLDPLSCDQSASEAAYEFLTLSAEHAAADDLDTT